MLEAWQIIRLNWARTICSFFDHIETTINDPINPGWMVRCCQRCGKGLE